MNVYRGQILIFALIILAIISMLTAALLERSRLDLVRTRLSYNTAQARSLAEAGIDKALYELNRSGSYTGETNTDITTGDFIISIATIDPTTKQITAVGYVPSASDPDAQVTLKAKATIDTTTVAFNYGVQVGAGGLTMSNTATINGNVYSNGSIQGANSAQINGDAIVAGGGAEAPDQQCTANSSSLDLNNTATRLDAAQQFTPSVEGPLSKISVYLKKSGNPTDLSFKLVTNSASNAPTKTILASGSIPRASVTSSFGWIDGTFTTAPLLTAGVTYWLILDSSGTAANYYSVGTAVDGSCASGDTAYSPNAFASTPTWSTNPTDSNFKIFLGGVATFIDGVEVMGDARANTIRDCEVHGDAYYTTEDNCDVDGSLNPGATDPSPQAMPISDAQIAEWEAQAESGGVYSGTCPYTPADGSTIGPLKVNCDMVVGGIDLYLAGPIWIAGNLTIQTFSTLNAADSLGNFGTVLVADNPSDPGGSGKVSQGNNTELLGNGNPGSYLLVVSMNTSSSAVDIDNSGSSAIYYAPRGTIQVANSGTFNELTGFALVMSNSATVNYQSGLQSAMFTNGPGASWQVLDGTYVEVP